MSSSVDSGDYTGFLLAAVTMCAWQYYRSQQNVKKYENAYWGERRGRARVEQEMKRISNIQLNTDQGFFVQPIGEIHSCYRQCIGTPRQGLLAPGSRATIKLTSHISPESLVGLDSFSHVWITFKFHLNTNTLKESKNFTSRSTFNAKITLPMLKKKLGVFATRSPHRPNPVGITLAKIDRFDKKTNTIYLSACDLVEGTPVLDVKVRRLLFATFFVIVNSCLQVHYCMHLHMFISSSNSTISLFFYLSTALCGRVRHRSSGRFPYSGMDPGDRIHPEHRQHPSALRGICTQDPEQVSAV